MKVLFANNLHRGRGGADATCEMTIRAARAGGIDVRVFAKDSRDLSSGLVGKAQAFARGIYARRALAEFRSELAEFQPDVVHAFELYPMISPWILRASRRAGVPTLMTCCDYRISCPVASRFRDGKPCHECRGNHEYRAVVHNCRRSLPESFAFALRSTVARKAGLFTRYVDHFIAPSDFLKQWLIDDVEVAPNRVSVIPPAIEIPVDPVSDPAAGQYVAFAGRFVPEKGIEILLDAVRKIGLPLKLAGNASSHPAVQPADSVECVLTPHPGDLATFYRGARVVVVPSLFLESFGIVAAEAMSHGIPVVASNIGALPATLDHGRAGLLIAPGNADELSGALQRIWDDPELCRRLGAAGRQFAQSQYGHEAFFSSLSKLYQRIAGAATQWIPDDVDDEASSLTRAT